MLNALRRRLGDLTDSANRLALLLAEVGERDLPPLVLARALVDVSRLAEEMLAEGPAEPACRPRHPLTWPWSVRARGGFPASLTADDQEMVFEDVNKL